MKTVYMVLAVALGLTCNQPSAAQGTFQNLGFEGAMLMPIPGDSYLSVEIAGAFPGWTFVIGGVPWNSALHNKTFLDSSGISIIDRNWPNPGIPIGVSAGNYTAILMAGVRLGSFIPADVTLSQTSLVPVSAQSLRFRAFSWPYGSVRVLLGGERLTLFPLSSGANYTEFGADIRAWRGEQAQLDFTVIAQRPHVDNIYIFLDAIEFSPEAIPESGTLSLLGLGALFLGWRWRERKSS